MKNISEQRDVSNFLESNENEYITYPDLWGKNKSAAKRKHNSINCLYLKITQRFHTSNLTAH